MKRKNKIPKPETYSLGTLVNWEKIKGMDRRIAWELDRVLALFTKTALSYLVDNLTGFPENLRYGEWKLPIEKHILQTKITSDTRNS